MAAILGGVPEWLKGADCKSAGFGLRRFKSFPLHHPAATMLAGESGIDDYTSHARAGIAQLVEHQPSKLRVAGSSPVSRSNTERDRSCGLAHVAQSVEHFLGKEEVTGSNPVMGSSSEISFSDGLKERDGRTPHPVSKRDERDDVAPRAAAG